MILADFRLPHRLRLTIAQIARVTCPPELERLHLVESLIDRVEMQLRTLPTHMRLGLLAGLASFELSSAAQPATLGRTFSRLDRREAHAWFRSWWASPIGLFRQLARGIKGVVVFAYYEEPAVKQAMEYHPDQWIAEVARRRLESYGAEIQRHEDLVTARDPLVRPANLLKKRIRHA